jgi:hypothetical protein
MTDEGVSGFWFLSSAGVFVFVFFFSLFFSILLMVGLDGTALGFIFLFLCAQGPGPHFNLLCFALRCVMLHSIHKGRNSRCTVGPVRDIVMI